MNSTLALIINVPTLFLLYILTYFTQALSGKRQFYGISLNSDYFNKDEFKNLDKKYKLFTTIGFIISLILELASIYIFKAYVTSSILPMLAFCLYSFFVYINIHNKVKSLKSELSLNIYDLDLEKTKVILDTEFIQEKNKIVKKYSLLFTIPIIVATLVGIYVLSNYKSIPDTIPTHWGPSGNADAFADKSFIKILAIVGMMIIIILTANYQMYLYYKSPNKSKNAVYSIDDDDSLWIFGCIYNNPDDPSLFVNKRFGAGWTVNIGTIKGKIFFILPFIIVLFSLALI